MALTTQKSKKEKYCGTYCSRLHTDFKSPHQSSFEPLSHCPTLCQGLLKRNRRCWSSTQAGCSRCGVSVYKSALQLHIHKTHIHTHPHLCTSAVCFFQALEVFSQTLKLLPADCVQFALKNTALVGERTMHVGEVRRALFLFLLYVALDVAP